MAAAAESVATFGSCLNGSEQLFNATGGTTGQGTASVRKQEGELLRARLESDLVALDRRSISFVVGTQYWQTNASRRNCTYKLSITNVQAAAVPEPSSLAILALGAIGIAGRRRRKN